MKTQKTITTQTRFIEKDTDISLIITEEDGKKEVKILNEKDEKEFVFKTLKFDKEKKEKWLKVLKLLEKIVKSL